jgi:hypothetical protein
MKTMAAVMSLFRLSISSAGGSKNENCTIWQCAETLVRSRDTYHSWG